MTPEKKRLIELGLLVAVALGIGALVWWSELRQRPVDAERAERILPSPKCNPRGVFCLARDRNYSISLELDRNVTYLSPFAIRVKLYGFSREQVHEVRVRFTMADMYMGENQVALTPGDEPSEWIGSAILPVCITGRRDWVATVLVEGEEQVVRADFAFVIDGS